MKAVPSGDAATVVTAVPAVTAVTSSTSFESSSSFRHGRYNGYTGYSRYLVHFMRELLLLFLEAQVEARLEVFLFRLRRHRPLLLAVVLPLVAHDERLVWCCALGEVVELRGAVACDRQV